MENKEIINLYGFSLRANTLYEVTEKIDSMSPEEFKKFKTTKALMNDIKNIEPGAVYNDRMQVWDTGAFAESPMLRVAIADDKARAIALKSIQDNIVKPMETLLGVGSLGYRDNDRQWENYSIEVFRGKIFNTADPKDALDLFLCLLDKRLTPKEKVSDPHFKNSQYLIVDKEEVFVKEVTDVMESYKIMGSFEGLKQTNKSTLLDILNYLDVTCDENTSDQVLYIAFDRFLKDKTNGFQNGTNFLKACDDVTTDVGQSRILVYNKLKRMTLPGSSQVGVLTRNKSGEIYLGDQAIGSNYKTATETVLKDKKLEKLLVTLGY